MEPWRCQICGETYLGGEPADRCPFCGAPGKYLLSPAEYMDYGEVEMDQETRDGCAYALELELNNAAFYRACAGKAENQIAKSIFKRLAKHEEEHAELIADMMGIEEGTPEEVEIPDNDVERFKEAHEHEQKAIDFYLELARSTEEARVSQVFRALSDIELEHLKLTNIYG